MRLEWTVDDVRPSRSGIGSFALQSSRIKASRVIASAANGMLREVIMSRAGPMAVPLRARPLGATSTIYIFG